MKIFRILQLSMVAMVLGAVFAGQPIEFKLLIDSAVHEKQLEENGTPNPNNIRVVMSTLKTQASTAFTATQRAVTNFDYMSAAYGVKNRCVDTKDGLVRLYNRVCNHGFVKTCWSSLRKQYWSSALILPEHREYNRVFTFGQVMPCERVFSCPVTDKFVFELPARVVDNGFMNETVCDMFELVTKKMVTEDSINVSSRVMYLLCTLRQLQISGPEVYLVPATFVDLHKEELGRIALKLSDKELFDALRACPFLKITDAYFLQMLSYVVAHSLFYAYPLGAVESFIEQELAHHGDLKNMLMQAMQDLVSQSVFYKKAMIAVDEDQSSTATEPAKQGTQPAKKKRRRD